MAERMIDLPEAPTEKDYIIAYIDILGTKGRLAHQNTTELFQKVYYPFLLAGKLLPELTKLELQDIKIKIFSDNILFALPVNDCHNKNEVFTSYEKLGSFLKLFLSMFANKGILFRGAITVGKLFINDLMVWGSGLVTVVELEEHIAIYPRIILGEELLMLFEEFGISGVDYEEKFSCLIDVDDCVFFDFFDYDNLGETELILERAFSSTAQQIKEEKAGKKRPRILQKLYWYKNYLNTAERILDEVSQSSEAQS